MKQFGKSKTLLYFLFINISCVPSSHLNKSNRVIPEFFTYFYNDSLNLSIRYPGDYVFEDTDIRKRDLRIFKNYWKSHFDNNPVKIKNLIYKSSTDVAPYFLSGLFYPSRNAIDLKDLNSKFKNHVSDTLSYFERVDTTSSSHSSWLLRIYPYQQHFLVFMTFTDDKERFAAPGHYGRSSNRSLERRYKSMLKEYRKSIFPQLMIGSNYNTRSFKDPFKIADQAFFTPDSSKNYLLPKIKLASIESNYRTFEEKGIFLQASLTYNSFFNVV